MVALMGVGPRVESKAAGQELDGPAADFSHDSQRV